MDLLQKAEAIIREGKLFGKGDRIVVAVSGGPDSVALLHLLFLLAPRWKWSLSAAHFNHRFRGEESDSEADFVSRLAAEWGIPFELGEEDLPAYIEATGMNAQSAAREKRYAFLAEAAERQGAGSVALAHHADDQAETLVMRFLRGTGPTGLAGIPERRTEKKLQLIRPLLRITKAELLQYCHDQGLVFRLDSSNDLRKYTRNRIRLDLMPVLREYNIRLTESLVRLALMMGAEDDFMEAETARIFKEIVSEKAGSLEFSRKRFAGVHLALQRRLIKLILNCLSNDADFLDFSGAERIRSSVLQSRTSSLTLNIGGGLFFSREYDLIRFSATVSAPRSYQYPIVGGSGDLQLPEAGVHLSYQLWNRSEFARMRLRPANDQVVFDFDKLSFPLTVRSRRDGDRMRVLGLNGSKKVKDIFIDLKVPLRLRDRIPIVEDAEGTVLWIAGLRRSDIAEAGEHTERFFWLKSQRFETDDL